MAGSGVDMHLEDRVGSGVMRVRMATVVDPVDIDGAEIACILKSLSCRRRHWSSQPYAVSPSYTGSSHTRTHTRTQAHKHTPSHARSFKHTHSLC